MRRCLLFACLVLSATPAVAQPTARNVYNVLTYGALNNDLEPLGGNAAKIQAAITAAAASGGTVFFPSGSYKLTGGISVPNGVTLEGEGYSTAGAPTPGNPVVGSWIHVAATTFVPITIPGAFGVTIRRLAFYHDQPSAGTFPASCTSPYTPNLNYPFTIELVGNTTDTRLDDLLLLNPTRGIRHVSCSSYAAPAGPCPNGASGSAGGRLFIHRVSGQPLLSGIEIESMADVVHIDDVHFGAFFSPCEPVLAYQRSNARVLESKRNDHPTFRDIFGLSYQWGILFTKAGTTEPWSGVTTRARISDVNCDLCFEGVRIWADGVQAKISNLDVQNTGSPSSAGVTVYGTYSNLWLDNVHLAGSYGPAVFINNNNSWVMVDNSWIQCWDKSGAGFGAYTVGGAASQSRIFLGRNRQFGDPNPAVAPCTGTVQTAGPVGTIVLDN